MCMRCYPPDNNTSLSQINLPVRTMYYRNTLAMHETFVVMDR